MKKILVFPTWIIVRIVIPFLPKNHPWKNKKFSLENWAKHSTQANDMCSLFFWIAVVCEIIMLTLIL